MWLTSRTWPGCLSGLVLIYLEPNWYLLCIEEKTPSKINAPFQTLRFPTWLCSAASKFHFFSLSPSFISFFLSILIRSLRRCAYNGEFKFNYYFFFLLYANYIFLLKYNPLGFALFWRVGEWLRLEALNKIKPKKSVLEIGMYCKGVWIIHALLSYLILLSYFLNFTVVN